MLRGLRVLVTRPELAGETLCREIEQRGGHTIYFPTIAFAPPRDMTAYQQAIDQLGEQAWLVFISPQAVRAAVPDLRRRWPVLPPELKFAAVGSGTAAALRDAGYVAAVWPEMEWNSEGLLAMPAFQLVQGLKIAVVRGEGGREAIDGILAERGAVVLSVLAYRRVLPRVDVSAYLNIISKQPLDAIVCTSAEAMRNLKTLLGASGWPYIEGKTLIVMSQRVKLLAQDSGFQRICVTSTASNHAILETLAQIRNAL